MERRFYRVAALELKNASNMRRRCGKSVTASAVTA
jgi:hypothetical protein